MTPLRDVAEKKGVADLGTGEVEGEGGVCDGGAALPHISQHLVQGRVKHVGRCVVARAALPEVPVH